MFCCEFCDRHFTEDQWQRSRKEHQAFHVREERARAKKAEAEVERLREALVKETARRLYEEPQCPPGLPAWKDEPESTKEEWYKKALAALKEGK